MNKDTFTKYIRIKSYVDPRIDRRYYVQHNHVSVRDVPSSWQATRLHFWIWHAVHLFAYILVPASLSKYMYVYMYMCMYAIVVRLSKCIRLQSNETPERVLADLLTSQKWEEKDIDLTHWNSLIASIKKLQKSYKKNSISE